MNFWPKELKWTCTFICLGRLDRFGQYLTTKQKLKYFPIEPGLFEPFTVRIDCYLKYFANFRPSASNFNFFFWSLEQFFLTVGQNNFGNKMPFLYAQMVLVSTFFQMFIALGRYNFGFGQFHHLRIEDLQNFSTFFGSVSIVSENLRELIEN